MKMKIILVLLDGLGDRTYESLGYRTPLQAAQTPNLDRLATVGGNGLFHVALAGQCFPSETAHYILFGYDLETFPGRGLLEAVGAGLVFDDSDVLCLAHLSSVILKDNVPHLSGGRKDIECSPDEMDYLYESISSFNEEGIQFRLERIGFNDAILIMRGRVSPFVSDSDPMVVGRAIAMVKPLKENPEPKESRRTAMALNRYLSHCHRVLSKNPVNSLLKEKRLLPGNFLATQRCGRRIVQEPFEVMWGLKGMLISSGAMYDGLAKELGLKSVRVVDGKDPGDDLAQRIDMAIDDDFYDFIHVHTKRPDEAAHNGEPEEKSRVISALDRGLKRLVEAVEERKDLIVAVSSDHSTPSVSSLIHSGEPVPVTIAGPNVRRDKVDAFDEISAAGGCLGMLRGKELLLTLINYADRSSLHGHCLGEKYRPFFPKDYDPFK